MSTVHLSEEVRAAIAAGRPVVALESTLIAHGLPHPANVDTARASEAAVRAAGATPATIAVIAGVPRVGLSDAEIDLLATEPGVRKASRRDLGPAIARRWTAATTVSATMALAHAAGIRVFATGGIGGVHRPERQKQTWDVSADLIELGRTPVAVVCAGAKSLLDLPNTLEYLETQGVPIVGYGCDEFPAFYLTTSRLPVPSRVDDAAEIAELLAAHWRFGGAGVVIAQPPPVRRAIAADEFDEWLIEAERRALAGGVTGPGVTPFILKELATLSAGRTVALNQELIVANAGLAGQVSVALAARG